MKLLQGYMIAEPQGAETQISLHQLMDVEID
jgi:hypothetical protein